MTKFKKGICIFLIILFVAIILVGGGFGIYALVENFGTSVVRIDVDKQYQTVQGFGASSAWIFQNLGVLEDEEFKNKAIDMLYGDDGLSLNIFRYNIGAGGRESDNYWDPLRGEESFFIADRFNGDYSVFQDESNYDFSRDKGVVDLLIRALKTGNVRKIVFFAGSPHYFMTKNGKTHGEHDFDNNLKEDCYTAFSHYLLTITNYLYREIVCEYNEDIEIYISPVNEPQWGWGGDGATQECCHFDPKPLAEFYDVFYGVLGEYNQKNGTEFVMDIFESARYLLDDIDPYVKEFEKYAWFDEINLLSVHSYGTNLDITTRRNFRNYMDSHCTGKNVTMSEYCIMEHGVDKTIDRGIYQAKVTLRDLSMLNVTEWSYWLAVSAGDYEDGLVYWNDFGEGDILWTSKRYYAMKHFSNNIPNGSKRIKSAYSGALSSNGVECVAFEKPNGDIVLIVINDSDRDHEIKVKGVYNNVVHTLTSADVDWEIEEFEYKNSINVKAKSINTYVFSR